MSKQRVIPTKIGQKRDRFQDAILDIILYKELALGARKLLAVNKKLLPQVDIRLQIEINFCMNLLVNIFKVSQAYVMQVSFSFRKDKDFQKNVERFVEDVMPGASKLVNLYGEAEYRLAAAEKDFIKKQDKILKGTK